MSLDRDADDRAARGFARALVRQARQDEPPPASYHRARRAIATGVVVGGAIGGASVVTTTAAAAPKLTSLAFSGAALAKWGAMGVVAGAMTLGAIHQVRSTASAHLRATSPNAPALAKTAPREAAEPPVASATDPSLIEAVPPSLPSHLSVRPRPVAERSLAERPAMAPPDDLASELEMLDTVRSLLLAHASDRALVAMGRYRTTWPKGRLRLEATVLQIEALVQAGKTEAATALAKEFLALHSHTPFARRVRALVGLDVNHDAGR